MSTVKVYNEDNLSDIKKQPKIAPHGSIKHKHHLCDPPFIDVPNLPGTAIKIAMKYASKDWVKFILGLICSILSTSH